MPYFACTACGALELLASPPEHGEALCCPHCDSTAVLVLEAHARTLETKQQDERGAAPSRV